MRKSATFACMVLIALNFCCGILDDDSGNDDSGWKKASVPKQLQGNWYSNNVLDIKITSSKAVIDNREWSIAEVHKKEGEYRFIIKSAIQYRAVYFRNITDTSAEKSMGYIELTPYDAKQASQDSWVPITKT